MEKRNVIKLTERRRQTGASKEICAKFFSDPQSILIVQDNNIKELLWVNNFNGSNSLLKDRIVFEGSEKYEEYLHNYETWYLDICSSKFTKEILTLAFDKNKTLIGHYQNREEMRELRLNEKFAATL